MEKRIKYVKYLVFPIMFIYLEIIYKLATGSSFSAALVYPVISAVTLGIFVKFITSLLGYTPELKKALKMKKTQTWKEYKPFVDKNVREWLIPLIDMADVNFVVKGKELVPENEPIIYTPNHASMFDIPAVFLNAPTMPMFIAKKELSAFPFLKQWMWVLDCVFVDRKNKDGARSSLHDAIEMVKNGRSRIVIQRESYEDLLNNDI